ncbi:MAG: SdrD B-like domain-containing protein [Bacteroidia bacterium]
MKSSAITLLLLFVFGVAVAQYSEDFTGQAGKGLVSAICPPPATGLNDCGCNCTAGSTDNLSTCATIPPDLSGVNWTITGNSFEGIDHNSPDDFGVVTLAGNEIFQAKDIDGELCWESPTLNIGNAGPVSISLNIGKFATLEPDDYISAEYSLDGGAFVQFGLAADDFANSTLSVIGLTGSTLDIRICIDNDGGSEIIWFDNVSVPEPGVVISGSCTPPVLSANITNTLCGISNGAIDLSATGGSGSYTYLWSDGQTTSVINGLPGGFHQVTVTESGGCSTTDSFEVQTYDITGPYLESFDTPGKGYLTGMADELTGANWTLSPWTVGRESDDYFSTTASGMLETGDTDSEICWTSPQISIAPGQFGFQLSLDLSWVGLDPEDYISVLTSYNGGPFVPFGNIEGGGTATIQYAAGSDHTSSINFFTFSLPANTIQIRVCFFSTDDGELMTLDNVSLPEAASLCTVTDLCPNDPNKIVPGICGCGTPDTDSDGDLVPDCIDQCPNDPGKSIPGNCGCGVPETDSDGDNTPDCIDLCPNDPGKTMPGTCGCGNPDTDSDGDNTPDCADLCPNDPGKTAPGTCGCGTSDIDSDGDNTPDCLDGCPFDPTKTSGSCVCQIVIVDSDNDKLPDSIDPYPTDKNNQGHTMILTRVWDDINGDGLQSCDEPTGIAGVTVNLLKASNKSILQTAVTNSEGLVLFQNAIQNNNLLLEFEDVPGYKRTLVNIGNDEEIDSDASKSNGRTGSFKLANNIPIVVNQDCGLVASSSARTSNPDTQPVVKVFPNPAQNLLTVTFDADYKTLVMMDIQGRTILHKDILPGEHLIKFELSSIPSGVYLVRLEGSATPVIQRFIKE